MPNTAKKERHLTKKYKLKKRETVDVIISRAAIDSGYNPDDDKIDGTDITYEHTVYEMVARTMEMPRPAIQAEIKRLQALDKSIATRSEALRKRVQDTMTDLGIQKITCPLFEVRIQKNPPAVV